MRGFQKKTSVNKFIKIIKQNCKVLNEEEVHLEDLAGRVLSKKLFALNDVPNFNRSSMDGYALKAEETFGASIYNPIEFKIIGEVTPGSTFKKKIYKGQSVRIMTGSKIPEGANGILIAENAQENRKKIQVFEPVPPGKHIGLRGEDFFKGEKLLDKGRKLRPQDLGVISSSGLKQASVICKPKIDLFITGNEVVKPGKNLSGVEIIDSNSLMLKQLFERDGGIINKIKFLKDDKKLLKNEFSDSNADLICVTGGTSVGIEDYVPNVLKEIGTLLVHGIPFRPASPTAFGLLGNSKIFLLPGNPVSCLSAYDFFVGMAVRIMGGNKLQWPYRSINIKLANKISSQVGRMEYVRLVFNKGKAIPIALSGASILSSTTKADAFLITEELSEGFAEGTFVKAWLYD